MSTEYVDIRLVAQAMKKLTSLTLDSSGNLQIAVQADNVGLAKDSTLQSSLPRKIYGYDGSNWQPIKVTSDGKVVGVLQ